MAYAAAMAEAHGCHSLFFWLIPVVADPSSDSIRYAVHGPSCFCCRVRRTPDSFQPHHGAQLSNDERTPSSGRIHQEQKVPTIHPKTCVKPLIERSRTRYPRDYNISQERNVPTVKYKPEETSPTMPQPSRLAIATASIHRLIKEEASYHAELSAQQARLHHLQSNPDGDENAEFQLRQEVSVPSPPSPLSIPPK